ncbi:hypothetical protein ACIQOW_36665 [Kitasatospora sp. NPDC091335]|uniref:hypothetical protein n=1 Tax=Kitasatospora sp. NPDC091335 TaxID=3364085 RepID=UPI00380CDB39
MAIVVVRSAREIQAEAAGLEAALQSMGAEEADLSRTAEALRAFWRARLPHSLWVWAMRLAYLAGMVVPLVATIKDHPSAGVPALQAVLRLAALWGGGVVVVAITVRLFRPLSRAYNDLADVERYELIRWASLVVTSCGHAFSVSPIERVTYLRWISYQCAGVERGLRRAHRTTRHTRLFSPRRKEIRAHAARVIGSLRQAEAKLDQDPESALRELAVMVVTISENYAAGKYVALLPEDKLAQGRPARDWERVWFLGAWLLSLGLAWAVSQLSLPSAVGAPLSLLAVASPFIARWGVEGGFSRFALTRGSQ